MTSTTTKSKHKPKTARMVALDIALDEFELAILESTTTIRPQSSASRRIGQARAKITAMLDAEAETPAVKHQRPEPLRLFPAAEPLNDDDLNERLG